MRCPYCGAARGRVVDSRTADHGTAVRRRRECLACRQRFSTYERAERVPLAVRKRSGAVEAFDHAKMLAGMRSATANLPIAARDLEAVAAAVAERVRALPERPVPSERIGAEVLAALREIDSVAYVRFASVYKSFTSPEDFRRELAHLELDKQTPPKRAQPRPQAGSPGSPSPGSPSPGS